MIRRFLSAAVVVLVVFGGAALAAPPAQAAGTAGYCPDASGVTVVVDFRDLGGGVVIRCAPGDQSTGLGAMKNAGFAVVGTIHDGPGFICRIDGKPTVAAEPCVKTPPITAYWSYWHAPDGGSWTYSQLGAANRKPPSGSFEGWSFSKGQTSEGAVPRPGVAPKRPAAPPPAGGGTQPGGGGTQPGGGGQPGGAQPGGEVQPPGAAATPGAPGAASPGVTGPASPGASGAASPGASGAAAGGGSGSSPGSSSGDGPATDVATRPTGATGMPAGTLAGVGLLLVFAVAAGITVWRRRRSAVEEH